LLQHDPAAALSRAQLQDPSDDPVPGESDFIIGAASLALGREDAAEISLRAALERNPTHRLAGIALAHLLRDQGRYRAAVDTVASLLASIPQDIAYAMNAIQFLLDCQQTTDAERLWTSTKIKPDANAWHLGGEIALSLGEFAVARERFDRCLALDPFHPAAIQGRSLAGLESERDPFIEHLDRLAQHRSKLPDLSRVILDFAAGKLAMDRGQLESAFAHFDRANNHQGMLPPSASMSRTPRTANPAQTKTADVSSDGGGSDLVLIIGMPRSGTTLLASRIGKHSHIVDRGELPWLSMIGHSEITPRQYVRHLHRDDAPKVLYLDKNPLNFLHLPIVARNFPNARILHCRRDPRDVAISCYTQHFQHPDLAWSRRWEDIVSFQRHYRQCIEERPPGLAWFDLDYRKLVEETEPMLRRVTDFLGIDWEPLLLDPASLGPIATASVWQARQPIHCRSIARWRDCSRYIPELLAAYGDGEQPENWF
jgi:tetratricopeptide (TPR) repeat protein